MSGPIGAPSAPAAAEPAAGGTVLTARRHVDLLRVIAAACRTTV